MMRKKLEQQGNFQQDKQNFRNSQNVNMKIMYDGKSQSDLLLKSKYKNLPCYSIKNSLIESPSEIMRESEPRKNKQYRKNQSKAKIARKIKMLTQSDLDDHTPSNYDNNFYENESNQQSQQTSILIQQSGFLEHKFFDNNLIIKFQQISLKTKRNVSLKDFIKHVNINFQTSHFYSIKKLVINHGNIRSLAGIQQFQNLEEINLKNNDIRQVQQIYKISQPQKVRILNFKGNDIEDYFNARYENLIKYFPNLIELNDKDYSFLKLKRKEQKKVNLKKILRKTANVQKQLMKTLKRQSRQSTKYFYQYAQSKPPTQYSQNYQNNTDRQGSYSPTRSQSHSNSRQINRNQTKSKYKNSQISQQEYSDRYHNNAQREYEYLVEGNDIDNNDMNHLQTEPNHYKNRTPLKEVSLGNIQNVPLAMSVNGQKRNKKIYNQNGTQLFIMEKMQKNSGQNNNNSNCHNKLMINTSEIQESHRALLTQPTATFAMQKQKQRQFDNGETKQFMFKTLNNKENQNKLSNNIKNKDKNQRQGQNFPCPLKSANKSQKFYQEEPEFYDMDSEVSLGGISKISYNCHTNMNNDPPTKRMQRNSVSNASFFTTINNNQQNLALSHYNAINNRNSFINGYQNQSYLTSYTKINQSMDQNCFLKQNKTELQRAQQETAVAFYLSTLRQKCFIGLVQYYRKRKDMPRKRVGF